MQLAKRWNARNTVTQSQCRFPPSRLQSTKIEQADFGCNYSGSLPQAGTKAAHLVELELKCDCRVLIRDKCRVILPTPHIAKVVAHLAGPPGEGAAAGTEPARPPAGCATSWPSPQCAPWRRCPRPRPRASAAPSPPPGRSLAEAPATLQAAPPLRSHHPPCSLHIVRSNPCLLELPK